MTAYNKKENKKMLQYEIDKLQYKLMSLWEDDDFVPTTKYLQLCESLLQKEKQLRNGNY
jgi:hypothetical protein